MGHMRGGRRLLREKVVPWIKVAAMEIGGRDHKLHIENRAQGFVDKLSICCV